jgi:hypothetical protein
VAAGKGQPAICEAIMDITVDYKKLQLPIEQIIADFQKQADANQLIQQLRTILFAFIEELIGSILQKLFYDQNFLATLKLLGAKSALRFNGFIKGVKKYHSYFRLNHCDDRFSKNSAVSFSFYPTLSNGLMPSFSF